jgi:hypothetical protein
MTARCHHLSKFFLKTQDNDGKAGVPKDAWAMTALAKGLAGETEHHVLQLSHAFLGSTNSSCAPKSRTPVLFATTKPWKKLQCPLVAK